MVNYKKDNELFDKINSELIQWRKYLELMFLFSTFEIMEYEKTEEYELVTFDLAAQNTGNIFMYKYYYKIGKYELCDYMMYSYIGSDKFSGFNAEVLDEIFAIARRNQDTLILKK